MTELSEKPPSVFSEVPGNSSVKRTKVHPEITDRLREISWQEDANPKIVIVGDRSTGKSALAEGLIGFTLCTSSHTHTRFATEITLHQSPADAPSIEVSLIPGPNSISSGWHPEHISRFGALADRSVFETNDLSQILDKAAAYLGLPHSGADFDEENARHYSDDILKIEIWAYGVQNLTVVDLPGTIHSANWKHQSQEEVESVETLISEYISNPNNIILAVADATNNIDNQGIFQVAQSIDPDGLRTIGAITKCDAVQQGDENQVIKLARNELETLHHGWFVVKGRSRLQVEQGVTISKNRAQEREFFDSAPWNELTPDRVGVGSLRTFTRALLYNLVQQSFANLLAQVQELAAETQQVADPFGTSINSFSEKAGCTDPSKTHTSHNIVLNETEETDDEIDLDFDLEAGIKKRPTLLWNAIFAAFTFALSLFLIGLGCRAISNEISIDGHLSRLGLIVVMPLLIFISLFFCQTMVYDVAQIIGPVSHMKRNSKYYSAVRSPRLNIKNGSLPHMTIQCPVYKEGLKGVIRPTVESLSAAIRDYQSRGGTANIFINDDGMQLIPEEEARARQAFYKENKIGWVARPGQNPNPGPGERKFIRKGKFKKASNMNYGLMISLKVEDKVKLIERHELWTQRDEDEAYQKCLAEVLDEDEGWTKAGGDIRIGDYILLVDSDTRVPVSCLIDAASEMEISPRVAIIQYSSAVMQVTTSFFESGITWFTNLIYTAIRFGVSSGDVSAFIGHNAVLRWSALQETSFYDYDAGPSGMERSYEKFWSESHVSEDFDMALRLQTQGYYVRMASYTGEDFKEGVSLTVYDELARWEKYAYGCNELVFHPLKYWLYRGPFTPLWRKFIFSSMPIGSKATILAYIGTYYAIGYTWVGALMNYFLIGWMNGYLDHFYIDSFRTYFAIICVFTGAGNLALAVIRYRAENKVLYKCLWENLRWIPLLSIFLGGLSMHVSQALLCHFFSIDMSWGATSKETENTTFFIELPRILRRFKYSFIFCISASIMMISGALWWPYLYRINFVTVIWPLASVVGFHFLLPVLLNPALMHFTW